jgi:alpha-beta hydrolase superfamily lysophospholipase
MIQETMNWKTQDGLNLYSKVWEPEETPIAVIAIVHGLGEHCNRYEHVAAYFTDKRYAVMSFDQRGHGQSEGPRGHAPSYQVVMKDIEYLLSQCQEKYPDIPCFLYGHSMGGSEVLYYGLTQDSPQYLSGIIATSPGIRPANMPAPLTMALGKLLSKIIPTFPMDNELDVQGLSQDPEVIQAYKDDPMVHPKISAKHAMEMIFNGQWMLTQDSFPKPLLLLQGENDRLVDPKATIDFAKRLENVDHVSFKLWNGGYHELHNEPFKNEVFDHILTWINNQIDHS